MKIVFLTFAGFDSFAGNNHLNITLLKSMLDKGYDVVLIQSNSGGEMPLIPKELSSYENLEVISIRKKFNKNNFIKRALEEIKFLYKASKYIKKSKADCLYYQTSGLLFVLSWFLTFNKTPMIVNVQDMFPDSIETTGVIKNKFVLNLVRHLQKAGYIKAKKITVLSDDMRNSLVEKYKVPADKVEIVYNWYDDSNIKDVIDENNVFIKKYGLKKDKFIVQYACNLGYVLNYDYFIELAKELRNEKDVEIQIVGDGSRLEVFKSKVEENNLGNISFLPLQPQETVADVYSYCDICLIPLKQGVIRHSVPSKVGIVMACKKLVLLSCDEDSKYGELLNGIGCFVGVNDYKRGADFIREMRDDREKYQSLVNKAYEFNTKTFSSTENIKRLMGVINEVINENCNIRNE